jgi:hypothetical protein
MRQDDKSGTLSCATERLTAREQSPQKLAEDRKSIDWEIALPETKQVAGRLTNNR